MILQLVFPLRIDARVTMPVAGGVFLSARLVRLLQNLFPVVQGNHWMTVRQVNGTGKPFCGGQLSPLVNKEGDIMNGAVPYYKIQERTAPNESEAVIPLRDRPENFQILLCNMAHHVNNLLMRIQGYASLMLMDVKEGHAGFERLKHIENYVGYGAVLTSQLLAFTGRGVYADPVNIPPLLLEQQVSTGATPGVREIRSRLFIVNQEAARVRSGSLSTCHEIVQKIAVLFAGIENVSIAGRFSRIEKQYIGKIKTATGEGCRIARDVNAVFQPAHAGEGGQAASRPERALETRFEAVGLG
jgi:hypothetical protein